MSNAPSLPVDDVSHDLKPCTIAADHSSNDGAQNSTVQQDTAVGDGSVGGSVTSTIANFQGHSTPVASASPPTNSVVPDAVVSVFEIPSAQDDNDGEVWIPKGAQTQPNASQTKATKPARPSQPKRDD
ncbi:hypothetical protein GSI_06635 [Ganoderma sinense ZZ0214-1]|uniref:Uncharacterized protein n=1 Tax=Ganoderma sinense ZZ0214-1 TaxID=1077348 RepID=A0A2G8SDV5_9APHY|nr:hypothetical protein GSI_06635 [Ganoderma sinense ZZ0214-1]